MAYREARLTPPPGPRTHPATAFAIIIATVAVIAALFALWSVIVAGLITSPNPEVLVFVAFATALALLALDRTRAARSAARAPRLHGLALALAAFALAIDALAGWAFYSAATHPPRWNESPRVHDGPGINRC